MTWWKRFVRLLLLAALLPLAGRLASAQQTVVSNYATLSAAIASSAVITNFLANSVISLTNPGQTFLITNNTTIDGTSNNIVIDGNNAARLFHVSPAAQLVLNNVQLLRGLSTNGGAIFNEGALIINNAIMAGNSATNLNGTNGVNATNGVVSGTDATAGGGAMGGAIYSLVLSAFTTRCFSPTWPWPVPGAVAATAPTPISTATAAMAATAARAARPAAAPS